MPFWLITAATGEWILAEQQNKKKALVNLSDSYRGTQY